LFSLQVNQDLAVGILLVLYIHLFTFSVCPYRRHARGNKEES